MSDSIAGFHRKIASAGELQSVVRTMKALAASSIAQYEKSVRALADYYHTVELGLGACFRDGLPDISSPAVERKAPAGPSGAIVFGSDQGLVGQFNDLVAEFAVNTLATLPGKPLVWAVGERVAARLQDAGLPLMGLFPVPHSVQAIAPLVGQIQITSEARRSQGDYVSLHLFHNRPHPKAGYEPVSQRLLPLDTQWRHGFTRIPWPGKSLPDLIGGSDRTLPALIREYLFISLFRASAESLASENASRLAAMERAEKNIGELMEDLTLTFHRLRQAAIDDELFDVVAGYESLASEVRKTRGPQS